MNKQHMFLCLLLGQISYVTTNYPFIHSNDPENIAIAIGSSIETITHLSTNFSHVITVNTPQDLKTSQSNVIMNNQLLGKEGISFKQFIHDHVYQNNTLKNKKISFILCDINGGEEAILEDMLYFAFYNKINVFISFSLDNWLNKDISCYKYIFNFFQTNDLCKDVCSHLEKTPQASILFEPKDTTETLIKKNIPAVIIGYNLVTYIKNMVHQLEKYTNDIIIVDNNSTYQPLLDYYQHEFKYTLLKQPKNYGHAIIYQNHIQSLLGDIHIITDPDLQFNKNLPDNFLNTFIKISEHFKAHKVGFALDISSDNLNPHLKSNFGYTIRQWEGQNWIKKLYYPYDNSLDLYNTGIDTTFCLVNKKYFNGVLNIIDPGTQFCIRVAGDYTCLHLPWYNNFKDDFLPGEYEYYIKNTICSSWKNNEAKK